ncbi:MAG: antibiotic biosynthesis monooxygenase (ABM) superfamily enzyme [Cellvibrionaceae bacterium]|jgi:antibiotic biosynthesis monooxygenase (ABM) superfamily enzyme
MNITEKINEDEDPITIMFVDKVKPEKIKHYENWLNGIHGDMKGAVGFMDVAVIRLGESSYTEYTVLIKFDNYFNLAAWRESEAEDMWLSKHADLVQETASMQQTSGLDIWFNRPNKAGSQKSAYWKQVALGVTIVYPMILILNILLSPITDHLSFNLSLLLNVVVMSALLTYPVMPFASKLLDNWLYPKI